MTVGYHMHEFTFKQEALWCSKSGRLEVDPHRVTRPAARASSAPDHVHQPGSLLILRRKLAVSRDIVSHAFQSQSDGVFHRFRQSWRCQPCRALLCHQEEGDCSPKVLVFCDWAVLGANGCLCCAVALEVGRRCWLAPGPGCSRPTPSGPLASRIAVAFPRPGPPEAQCF